MPTTNHPPSLPEQEPTSPTAVVLCDGETWVKTGADWESLGYLCSWGDLRDFAAGKGGATLYDLADLPTGLTEVQKGAVRSIESKFLTRGGLAMEIRNAFPEAFGDLVTATWKYAYPYEKLAELLRVARMEGAHAVAAVDGVTHSGAVSKVGVDHIIIGGTGFTLPLWQIGWTVTVAAPKPADPTGGDPVVRASLVNFIDDKKYIFFRAQDGRWSRACDSERGMWGTESLTGIERLSAQTIAELMGGER